MNLEDVIFKSCGKIAERVIAERVNTESESYGANEGRERETEVSKANNLAVKQTTGKQQGANAGRTYAKAR